MRRRVIFVDDERSCLDSYRRILRDREAQWDMAFVANGADALRHIRQEPFDVACVDYMMPGMDGVELLRHILETCPKTQVIVVTGFGDITNAVKMMKLGAVDYLQKPLPAGGLEMAVEAALENASHHPAGALVDEVADSSSGQLKPSWHRHARCDACGHEGDCTGLPPLSFFACESCGAEVSVPLKIESLQLKKHFGDYGAFRRMQGIDLATGIQIVAYIVGNEHESYGKIMGIAPEICAKLASLKQSSVSPLLRYGEADGYFFAAEPLIGGYSLDQYDHSVLGETDVDGILEILQAAGVALAVAHSEGIVHHGLRLENFQIDARGNLRIKSFLPARLNYQLEILGEFESTASPYFISPERAANQSEDEKGDVFGMGVLAYYLLTGVYPYRGHDDRSTVLARLPMDAVRRADALDPIVDDAARLRPVSPTDIRPDVPPDISVIILKMLMTSPKMRPRIAELLDLICDYRIKRERVRTFDSVLREMVFSSGRNPIPQMGNLACRHRRHGES